MSQAAARGAGFSNMLQDALRAFQAGGPLEAYDETTGGPLLGVSDGGEATRAIVAASLASAKAQAAGEAAKASRIGVIVDAERMGSGGEVPVGPEEYAVVAEAASGRSYASTNVGVRSNARYHQPYPEVDLPEATGGETAILEAVLAQFEPFLNAPGGARPLTVRLRVPAGIDAQRIHELARGIRAGRGTRLASEELHRIALLAVFDAPVRSEADVSEIERLLGIAAESGVDGVAIDGPVVEAARIKLGVQGILNVLEPVVARKLLRSAAKVGRRLVYRYQLDVDTVTRTIWSGLLTARANGLHAAKYGLVPLTFEEQRAVIPVIQRWFDGWTAVPAFYADVPLVTDDDVFLSDRLVEAAERWLRMAVDCGAKMVLFDCPDRHMPRIDVAAERTARRILKRDASDVAGAFTLDEARRLVELSRELGVRILWSGGIQPRQAYELARLGVGGIFTTSSTAQPAPVGATLKSDPRLAVQGLPTELGVRRIHALIQAGFLSTAFAAGQAELVPQLEAAARLVELAAPESAELRAALEDLDKKMVVAWSELWRTRGA